MENNNVQVIPAKFCVENDANGTNISNEKTKKLRVAAYCRVSKNSKGLERSLNTQITYFEKIINENPNWQLAGIYIDDGISGTGIERRIEFQKMVEKGVRREIDLILTKSVTRFARNTVDLLNTIRKLKDAGCEVRFEKESISTFSKDGELLLTILAAFSQAEAESISANVKWAKQKARAKGKDQYHPIYGYDYKNGVYTVNDFEGKIVKEIFDRFLKGETYKQIADSLKKRKVKTRKGNDFNYPQVKIILKNEKYAGFTILQKHFSSNPISHKIKINSGQLPKYKINNTHPTLISLADFNVAQEKISALSFKYKREGRNVYAPEKYFAV